jgi:hypothetical protein
MYLDNQARFHRKRTDMSTVQTQPDTFAQRDADAMKWAAYGGGIAAFVLVFVVIIPLGSERATPDVDYPTPAQNVQPNNR